MPNKSVFENSIKSSNEKIDDFKKNIDQIFHGTQMLSPGEYRKSTLKDRIADVGILGILDQVSSLNLCSLLSYQVNLTKNIQGYQFDPTKQPSQSDSSLVKNAYNLQYKSYVIQSNIDGFIKSETRDIQLKDFDTILNDLVNQLKDILDNTKDYSVANKNLLKAFPSLLPSYVYLNSALTYFSTTNNNINILNNQTEENKKITVKKIMLFVNDTRTHCIKIQSINIYAGYNYILNPASQVVDSVLQSQLKQLNSIIGNDLSKLIPMLQTIRTQLAAITKFCQLILSTIRAAQSYVNIAVGLVKVLTIVSEFLKSLPIPNMFTIVGINVRFGDALKKISDFVDTVTQDLNSVSGLLNLLSLVISDIYNDIQSIINDISKIIGNLESCSNAPQGLVNDLKDTLATLQDTSNQLNTFVQNKQNKSTQINNTYGDYTIQIIKEELLQRSSNIPRRYGIALDKDGIEVVKSTPTFASNDSIIIEEVKLLLESKKLIKIQPSSLSTDQQASINQALSYIEDSTVTPDVFVDINYGVDSPDNEDENNGLGLNAFINKQKGGKALRNRMRAQMANANAQLQQNLNNANHG